MNVLKIFLYACAAGCVLVALVILFGLPGGIGLFKVLGAAALGALAYVIFRQAQTFNVQASDSQRLQFEQTYKQLAEKNGGVVTTSQMMNATGDNKDGVQAKMKQLVGRGVCEIDFAPNGEMQFKLTPMDEARAQLAAMREKP